MTCEPALDLTRRQLFSRTSGGLGIAALANLLSEDLVASSGQPHLPGLPHFAPQGEAGDLPLPVRRPVADGPVRPEAGPARAAGF